MSYRTFRILVLLALLLGMGRTARAETDGLAPWRDIDLLRRRLDEACTAVEAVCGARFQHRPGVRISVQSEVEAILRARDHTEQGLFEQMPDDSRTFLAYYDPIGRNVHILPAELGRVATALKAPEILTEDVLRIILVHEATHALDFQRFPVKWTLSCCARSDERLAIEAVLEGHAQLVSEEVARAWGIETGFQKLTRLYTGAYAGGEDFDQEAAFTYLQGHAFVRSILGARGRRGVEAVLRDPPCETRIVDRPLLWLDPARRGEEPDLQATLEVFRPLVTDPTWEVAKWRLLGTSVEQLTQAHAMGAEPFEGYVDNHGLYAGSPAGDRYLNVFIASWSTPEEAGRFQAALERVDRRRDAEPGWDPVVRHEGAGAGYRLPGFTSYRQMLGAAPEAFLAVHVARAGRHVIELSSWGVDPSRREAQDGAVDVAARLLVARPAEAVAEHLRRHVTGLLEARDAGDEPAARLWLRDLLPSDADLRRVVRPAFSERFEAAYRGARLEVRTTPVPPELARTVFDGAPGSSRVRAYGATTEELARGDDPASVFPPEMRAFAREVADPGVVWLVLSVRPPGTRGARHYACFARLGDRFLWIVDPWTVLQ